MKRKLETLFLLLAVGLLSLSRAEKPIKLGQGNCGDLGGVEPMTYGYDIRTYKFPGDGANGRKEEIFDWTCKNKATTVINGEKKFYPDQFAIPIELDYKAFDANATFLDHYQAFTKQQRTGVEMTNLEDLFRKVGSGIGAAVDIMNPNISASVNGSSISINTNAEQKMGTIGAAIGAFISELYTPPHTKTLSEYSESLRNTHFRVAMNFDLRIRELNLKNPKHLMLQQDFIDDMNALPASFLKNPEPFLSFIGSFGTHYMKHAVFGGRVTYSKSYDTSHYSQKSKEVIQTDFTKFFQKHSDTNTTTSEEESKSFFMKVKSEIVGGNIWEMVVPYTKENIQRWEKSVYNSSTPVHVTLVPITDLIANDSLRFEVAQAIVYSGNKAHVDRYRMLMNDVISKNSVGGPREPSLGGTKIGDFDKFYAGLYDEMDYVLRKVYATYESMITKMTKEVHEQARVLTTTYQNVKTAYELWNQVLTWNEVDEAVNYIHNIYKNDASKWYSQTNAFDGREVYTEKAWETLYLIGNITKTAGWKYGKYDALKKLSTINDFNEKMFWLKEAVDKYLKVRTSSCEDVAEKDKCYTYTICTAQVYLYNARWRADQDWRNYQNNAPEIKAFATMLTSMQHPSWESKRKELYESKFKQCNVWYADDDIEYAFNHRVR